MFLFDFDILSLHIPSYTGVFPVSPWKLGSVVCSSAYILTEPTMDFPMKDTFTDELEIKGLYVNCV